MSKEKELADRLSKIRIELCIGHNLKPNRYCLNGKDPLHWNIELTQIIRELDAISNAKVADTNIG